MAAVGVKRKRRPKNVCPNPVFVKWLEEWRDEAMENGSKISYTFNKALYSMKRYPLPINSGQEAKVLDYVGDKVANLIDKKIAEFLANGGTMDDLHSSSSSNYDPSAHSSNNRVAAVSRSTGKSPKAHSQTTATTHSQTASPQARSQTASSQTCSRSETSTVAKRSSPDDSGAPPKKQRRRSTKEYIPNYRSGPYALLMALLKAEQTDDYKGFLLKSELIATAQPLCESSFTVPDPPDSHYTAWSSMSNLLKKALVTKSGHPPRFSLTDTGLSLSMRLEQFDKDRTASSSDIITTTSNIHSFNEVTCSVGTGSRDSHVTVTCNQPTGLYDLMASSSMPYMECTDPLMETHPSDDVTITISDSDDDDDVIEVLPLAQRLGLRTSQYPQTQTSSSQTQSRTCGSVTSSSNVISTSLSTLTSCASLPSTVTSCSSSLTSTITSCSSTMAVTNPSSADETAAVDLTTPLFLLRPGEYEIILCIDNSENTASRKSKSHFRGLLLEELTKNGVKFSVRNLNVGDFLWIARKITNVLPDQLRLPESQEIVLEHIVERKRMDDLADSIIDRRFHEQKFRMKQCGVLYPVYLVEEYGDMAHCKISQKALYQAVTNTQVMEDFFVKQTKDIRESIAYLTIMTRHLQQLYSSKTIKAYSVETMLQLQKQRHLLQKDTMSICGIPFDKFNEASIKNKVSTASEIFARQLIQIPGSSAEKAHSIIEIYPTVADLYEGYSKCSTEKDREAMLSTVRFGTSKRKIGTVLSKTLYSLYWKGE